MKYRNIAATLLLAAIGAVSGYASAENAANRGSQDAPQKTAENQQKVSQADRQFMMKAAGGGLAEVELGRLALDKATSPEVKRHAQHMIDDHTKANDELKGIASSKGVTLPDKPDPKHQALIDKLNGMSGTQFDKTYIREAGLNAHREMQTLFKKESTSGQDAEVKAFAQKTLPVVEQHLSDSQKLSAAAGGSASLHRKNTSASHRAGKSPSSSANRSTKSHT